MRVWRRSRDLKLPEMSFPCLMWSSWLPRDVNEDEPEPTVTFRADRAFFIALSLLLCSRVTAYTSRWLRGVLSGWCNAQEKLGQTQTDLEYPG